MFNLFLDLPHPDKKDVSILTNGLKANCDPQLMAVNITSRYDYEMQSVVVHLHFVNFHKTIQEQSKKHDTRGLIGYEVNWKKISEAEYLARNISLYKVV